VLELHAGDFFLPKVTVVVDFKVFLKYFLIFSEKIHSYEA